MTSWSLVRISRAAEAATVGWVGMTIRYQIGAAKANAGGYNRRLAIRASRRASAAATIACLRSGLERLHSRISLSVRPQPTQTSSRSSVH
jgi:hypothetical protein